MVIVMLAMGMRMVIMVMLMVRIMTDMMMAVPITTTQLPTPLVAPHQPELLEVEVGLRVRGVLPRVWVWTTTDMLDGACVVAATLYTPNQELAPGGPGRGEPHELLFGTTCANTCLT